ncbi:gamma-glutamylcyclotransferase [Bacillus sp. BRMEA1]|uniref:gamma-glutamylcyclotransferase n=1 Tax=Neobacillus endophyticus TaxID=2738405 RepID=UPI0015657AEC|nr:gamma-glutamylcyclotransferase family protein [Neobacillus endophyticus]NRD80063.1 gamma-glutamylcyclotransferase [Neobacillus endophyticus]
MNHYVFVYGTLRKHEVNHALLKEAILVAEQARTKGRLYDTGLGYPALEESENEWIYGELYLVTDEQLSILDELEDYVPDGVDNLYIRQKQMVYHDTGSQEAYLYFIAPDNKKLLIKYISSGDWKLFGFPRENQKILYFAYGSCMDHERFKKHQVEHFFQKVVGRGFLNGYTLKYTIKADDGGRADIVQKDGGIVEGIIYEIPFDCLSYLYKREGVAVNWYRPTFVDLTVNGSFVKDVLTFTVVHKEAETAPPSHYLEEIIRGGSGFLSEGYLDNIKEHAKYLSENEK